MNCKTSIRKKEQNIYDIILLTMIMYLISTMFLSVININKLLGFIFIVELLYVLLRNISKNEMLILSCMGLCTIATIITCRDIGKNIVDTIYFASTIFILLIIVKIKFRKGLIESVYKNRKLIKFIIFMLNIILLIMLVSNSCYIYEWGGARYFVGLSENFHTMASNLTAFLALIILYLSMKKFRTMDIFLLLPSCLGIFETGARTYLISVGVLILIYLKKQVSKHNVKFIIYPFIALVIIYLFISSSMVDKFNFVDTNEYVSNGAEAFTNGRSVFWLEELEAYKNSNILNMILGHGFDYVYRVNYEEYGMNIWAHNDVIHVLLGNGIVGLSILFYTWCKVIREFMNKKVYSLKALEKILICIFIFGVAIINGTIVYIHYSFAIMYLLLIVSNTSSQLNIDKSY